MFLVYFYVPTSRCELEGKLIVKKIKKLEIQESSQPIKACDN